MDSAESVVVDSSGQTVVVDPGVGGSTASGDPERTYPMIIIAVLLATVVTIWHAVVMLRGYFWQDDFLYVYRAATMPLFEYLGQDYNGHFMPGQFLLAWMVTRWAPLNWEIAVLPLIALQILGYVLFWRLLVRMFGYRLEILLPFAVFVASPLVFAASSWWAYALQIAPFQVALIGALYAHVGYLQTRNPRQAIVGLVWTVAGLLFWEKALLIVPAVFVVTVIFMDGGLVLRVVAAIGRYRRLWLGYASAVIVYMAVYLRAVGTGDGLETGGGDVVTLSERMLLDTFLPGVLGAPWQALVSRNTALEDLPLDAIPLAAGIVAAGIVLAGLWVGRTRAVAAWALLLGYLACEVGLVAAFRLQFIGPVIGEDIRYVADAVPLAALCATLAFLRPQISETAAPPPRAGWPTITTLGFSAVITVIALFTIAAVTPLVSRDAGRHYVKTAAKALRANPGTVLYDGPVPDDVMIGAFGRYARTSTIIAPLGLDVSFDQPTDDLRMLDETGVPRHVVLKNTVKAPVGPVPNCGYRANQVSADITFRSKPAERRQVVRLGYFTNRIVAATVTVGNRQVRVTFLTSLNYLYLTVPTPSQVMSVDLAVNDTTVCITDVLIGTPRPG